MANTFCSFYDGSTRCRQDQGSTGSCKGDHARCPRLGIYMLRPKVVRRELDLTAQIIGGHDVNRQSELVEKTLAWVLGRHGLTRPSKWWNEVAENEK